ncbi:prepilin peptidase [Cellulomonas fengjieae]|uniref:Prepilin leader peptidase/N-methyltransferase n=1 Tax=Cellulomonas fengjieae TaxID=2819978 RepID=A0ABS3SIH2_9CELL|nr:A24 family peptidase [Cellulomonas fengjieae]MBO3085548.1 prepilin peptidase [Cellulomonas fengjieae]MBO3102656.1 prepilin peptidase [Cellulomonas fengjieae]QVI64415.1 prepilin peptidase [Cellulomonas fengjieae]
MTGALIGLSVVIGSVIGSFLNVVVWRVPRGESVVSPPSACPQCAHPIRPYDNVPIVSWLLLRGRCRDCGAAISGRYPAVELGTGVAFALVTWWLGVSWALPAFWYLAAIAIALALIDIDVNRLPDAIVLPSYPVALALLALASWNPTGEPDWAPLLRAALGAAILFAVYFVLIIVYPKGMGFGDVKLAGVLGLYLGWVGWDALVVGWFAAFLLGGVFSVGLLLTRRAKRGSGIPFGPWMLAGAAVGLVLGPAVADWYVGLL